MQQLTAIVDNAIHLKNNSIVKKSDPVKNGN